MNRLPKKVEETLKSVIDEVGAETFLKVVNALAKAGMLSYKFWTGDFEKAPQGVKKGVEKLKEISKKCKVKGVVRHPTKGYIIPASALCRMVVTGKIKDKELVNLFSQQSETLQASKIDQKHK